MSPIPAWLGTLCFFILSMITVGAITRLTGSGLSIVDWNPIMGAIPPLSNADWETIFRRYQDSPQYRLVNAGMALAEFKKIFLWEYIHRLLGRTIGIVFIVPWLYFIARKHISRRLAIYSLVGFALGGLQGALGWFMVKSGLTNLPQVSHYRLALHLLLALFVLVWFFWLWLGLRQRQIIENRGSLIAILILTVLQITTGAFVAGLKAGFHTNTFPTMNGEYFPASLWRLEPIWLNLFENPMTVQFTHRWLGIVVATLAIGTWARTRRSGARLIALVALFQVGLGIATLVLVVPIPLAVAHQLGAVALLLSVVAVLSGRVLK